MVYDLCIILVQAVVVCLSRLLANRLSPPDVVHPMRRTRFFEPKLIMCGLAAALDRKSHRVPSAG